jgi:hypothetical protein
MSPPLARGSTAALFISWERAGGFVTIEHGRGVRLRRLSGHAALPGFTESRHIAAFRPQPFAPPTRQAEKAAAGRQEYFLDNRQYCSTPAPRNRRI